MVNKDKERISRLEKKVELLEAKMEEMEKFLVRYRHEKEFEVIKKELLGR